MTPILIPKPRPQEIIEMFWSEIIVIEEDAEIYEVEFLEAA